VAEVNVDKEQGQTIEVRRATRVPFNVKSDVYGPYGPET
jgi:hypothetical protein